MNRYTTDKIYKTDKNVRYYETNIPKNIIDDDNDIYVISTNGDRLDIYADNFYNDPTKWTIIARANNLTDIFLKPELQIRIPAI